MYPLASLRAKLVRLQAHFVADEPEPGREESGPRTEVDLADPRIQLTASILYKALSPRKSSTRQNLQELQTIYRQFLDAHFIWVFCV